LPLNQNGYKMNEESSMIKCSNCNEPLEAHWDECPSCSTPTSAAELTCPNCQSPVKQRWKKCPNCKMPLTGIDTPPGSTTSSSIGTDIKQSQMVVSMMADQAGGETARNIELPLNEGDVLADKYKIVRPLGKGGFGAVYQVTDSVLNEDVALKIVVTGQGKTGSATEQLLHEFKLRDKIIDIDHVIRAQDPRPCEYKGLSLILLPMELADGGSMRKWLQQNRDIEKQQETGIDLFKQACLGVKAIHDAGLVHLDLKPENILIVNGRAKIADFGLGRFGAGQFASNPDQLLQQGIGTPEYMSPEQFQVARQKDIKAVSDIYSLGIILFELLDGSRPFDGKPRELKEKHLNMAPPQLAVKLELWGQIVSRCLAKEPQNRYPGIEHLINDLDRATKGATLSINVSCPKCNHINDNQDVKICQKCHADLDSFFHPCQACGKSVRLDIEICPVCQANVAGYYLLLERKDRITRLKDEDPAEAIELLETVLRDGADDYRQEALELIKDLRNKHSQINELAAQATKSMSSGQPEEAIDKWRKILRIIARHRHAQRSIQEAEILLKEFKRRWKQVPRLMDEANFEKADSLLQKCLELIPARDEVREMLDTCRQRAQTYSHAYDKAVRLSQQKQMDKAARELQTALSQAPKSSQALDLKEQLHGTVKKVEQLFRQVDHHLSCAEFTEAEKCIAEIKRSQPGSKDIAALKKKLAETQKPYLKAMKESQDAKSKCDLNTAMDMAQKALSLCPNSSPVQSMLMQIKADQDKAEQLIADAGDVMRDARFDDAESLLKQAEEIFPNNEDLQEKRKILSQCRLQYRKHFLKAKKAYEQKDLALALQEAESAKEICYDSVEPLQLIEQIKTDQFHVNNYLADIKTSLNAGDFAKARECYNSAKKLWPNYEELQHKEQYIASTEKQYRDEIKNYENYLKKRMFRGAVDALDRALNICPDSPEPERLLDNVVEKDVHQSITIRVVVVIVSIAGLIAAIYFSWPWITGTMWPYLINTAFGFAAIAGAIACFAAIVHTIRYTNIYRVFYKAAGSNLLGFFLILGVLIIVTAIPDVGSWLADKEPKYIAEDIKIDIRPVYSCIVSLLLALHSLIAKCKYQRVKQ